MWAVVEGHPSVVQHLVTAGTDLNIQTSTGFTALMQAARTRFIAAVLLLVGNGADLDIKDKKGRSVYDLGNQQVLQAIEKGKRDLRRRYLQVFQADKNINHFPTEIINTITAYLAQRVREGEREGGREGGREEGSQDEAAVAGGQFRRAVARSLRCT